MRGCLDDEELCWVKGWMDKEGLHWMSAPGQGSSSPWLALRRSDGMSLLPCPGSASSAQALPTLCLHSAQSRPPLWLLSARTLPAFCLLSADRGKGMLQLSPPSTASAAKGTPRLPACKSDSETRQGGRQGAAEPFIPTTRCGHTGQPKATPVPITPCSPVPGVRR